jgi:glycine cleavage system H protein
MNIPASFLYSDQHLWTKKSKDGMWLAGITDYAQDLLGDIVFIDPPKVGQILRAGQSCGLVESVKTGSDLHALVDGEVIEINEDLINGPEKINDHPYDAWIFKFKTSEMDLEGILLNAVQYEALIKS